MIKEYCDNRGYPGTRQYDGTFDGGDTAAVLGTLWFFGEATHLTLPWNYDQNAPLRHPNALAWYGQPDRFSRDQLIAVLCGMTSLYRVEHRRLFNAHKQKWFITAWNYRANGSMDAKQKFPDITGPEIWALWIRLKKPWWARLVLCTLDLETLVSAIHWRLGRKDRVTRNHMLICLNAHNTLPTLASRLANLINDWRELSDRWSAHCEAVGEYPTGELFAKAIVEQGLV